MNISIRVTGLPAPLLTKVGQAAVEVGAIRIAAWSATPYIRWVHEGTRRMRARPFIAQALESM